MSDAGRARPGTTIPADLRSTQLHYRPSKVEGITSCSLCGGAVVDDQMEQATHTKFHRTWTR